MYGRSLSPARTSHGFSTLFWEWDNSCDSKCISKTTGSGAGTGSSATLLGVCTVYPNAVAAVWPSPGCSQVAQRWPGTPGYILYFKFTPINVIKKGRIPPKKEKKCSFSPPLIIILDLILPVCHTVWMKQYHVWVCPTKCSVIIQVTNSCLGSYRIAIVFRATGGAGCAPTYV